MMWINWINKNDKIKTCLKKITYGRRACFVSSNCFKIVDCCWYYYIIGSIFNFFKQKEERNVNYWIKRFAMNQFFYLEFNGPMHAIQTPIMKQPQSVENKTVLLKFDRFFFRTKNSFFFQLIRVERSLLIEFLLHF